MPEEVIYQKVYSIRRAIPGAKTVEVTFPFEVIEQESRIRGITVDEFIKQFKVIAQYGSIPGVRYIFTENASEPVEEGQPA